MTEEEVQKRIIGEWLIASGEISEASELNNIPFPIVNSLYPEANPAALPWWESYWELFQFLVKLTPEKKEANPYFVHFTRIWTKYYPFLALKAPDESTPKGKIAELSFSTYLSSRRTEKENYYPVVDEAAWKKLPEIQTEFPSDEAEAFRRFDEFYSFTELGYKKIWSDSKSWNKMEQASGKLGMLLSAWHLVSTFEVEAGTRTSLQQRNALEPLFDLAIYVAEANPSLNLAPLLSALGVNFHKAK